MLDYFGQAPIIVRSSSLLEDSFGNAFAGKYRSEFCANQGSPEERLEAFLRAVKLVYASALNPDALSYRRRRGLGESDEQMAILVQRVSGMPYRQLLLPEPRRRGLLAQPLRLERPDRPEAGRDPAGVRARHARGEPRRRRLPPDDRRQPSPAPARDRRPRSRKYSQRQVDLLDLSANELVDRAASRRCSPTATTRTCTCLVSVMKDGYPADPWTSRHRDADRDAGPDLQQPDPPDRLRADHRRHARRSWSRPTATRWTRSSPPRWTPQGRSGSTCSSAGRCGCPGRRGRSQSPGTSRRSGSFSGRAG